MPAPSPAIRRVAAELGRALVIDRVAERNNFDKKALEKLLSLSDGQVLQADLPPLDFATRKPPPGLTGRDAPLLVQLAERGLLTIHDARRLPDGHYLLALGEGGVIRIDRYGRQLAQFPVPATRLVMAAGGQRALALVRATKCGASAASTCSPARCRTGSSSLCVSGPTTMTACCGTR